MDNSRVEIRVVYFDGCPSWEVAAQRLRTALAATGRQGTPVEFVRVDTPGEASEAGFAGSPTLLVDGRDLFPGTSPVRELTCRVYPSPEGPTGAPTVEALVNALTRARPRRTP